MIFYFFYIFVRYPIHDGEQVIIIIGCVLNVTKKEHKRIKERFLIFVFDTEKHLMRQPKKTKNVVWKANLRSRGKKKMLRKAYNQTRTTIGTSRRTFKSSQFFPVSPNEDRWTQKAWLITEDFLRLAARWNTFLLKNLGTEYRTQKEETNTKWLKRNSHHELVKLRFSGSFNALSNKNWKRFQAQKIDDYWKVFAMFLG